MANSLGGDSEASPLASPGTKRQGGWSLWHVVGPGLLVCLADTDAGCLIVAAQSGSRWGYALLPLQVVLIPVLFLAQELTIRLGVYTRQGHTACIRERFGPFWAIVSCGFLVIGCVGAIVSEMSGVASVAELWGFDRTLGTISAACLIIFVVVAFNYRQIEAIGIAFGLFELTFVLTMMCLHPPLVDVVRGSFVWHADSEYHKLIAANIGAVIMPWMIYFQQSAVVARKLVTSEDLEGERLHTLFGSGLTQLIMIAALVTMAAAPTAGRVDLETVKDIQSALTPVLGATTSKVLLSLAFVGGSLCAAFVVSLAAAWAVCEAGQWEDAYALDRRPGEAPYFYAAFLAVVFIGVCVLLTGVNIIQLNIYVELMDALLMPMAIGFLYALATGESLPPEVRVQGFHKGVLAVVFSTCSIVALVSGMSGLSSP